MVSARMGQPVGMMETVCAGTVLLARGMMSLMLSSAISNLVFQPLSGVLA